MILYKQESDRFDVSVAVSEGNSCGSFKVRGKGNPFL